MTSLRWGVVGLGIGEHHARMLQSLTTSSVIALCDREPETIARVVQNFSDVQTYLDPRQLMEESELDALVISTYDDSHGALAIEALEKGIHVFVEKPLATSGDQFARIFEALRGNPTLRLSSNTLLRYSPRFEWLRNQVQNGSFGRIFHAEMNYLYGRLEKVTSGWRGASTDYSATLGGTIHLIDLLLWLTGERPVRCVAVGSSLGTEISGLARSSERPSDDLRIALLEFPSGMTAQVGANLACVFPHFHSVAVFGSRATFFNYPQPSGVNQTGTHKPPALVFWSRDSESEPETVDAPYPNVPKSHSLQQFAESLQGGPPGIEEQDVLDATSVALAIDEAIRTRGPVEIRYFNLPPRHHEFQGD